MQNIDLNKYNRKKPIKEFDLEQTMYQLISNECKDDLKLNAIGFLGNNITYGKLLETSDKLAQAFYNIGVREGENVAILTIGIPIVQECLLSLSKIGATMSWIDLRSKEKDLIRYINNSNCKALVVFEDLIPLIMNIIDETNVEKVIISSPKDYLSPMIKVIAELKDKKDGKKIELPKDKRFIKLSEKLLNR